MSSVKRIKSAAHNISDSFLAGMRGEPDISSHIAKIMKKKKIQEIEISFLDSRVSPSEAETEIIRNDLNKYMTISNEIIEKENCDQNKIEDISLVIKMEKTRPQWLKRIYKYTPIYRV